jgi:hypothetical protein
LQQDVPLLKLLLEHSNSVKKLNLLAVNFILFFSRYFVVANSLVAFVDFDLTHRCSYTRYLAEYVLLGKLVLLVSGLNTASNNLVVN